MRRPRVGFSSQRVFIAGFLTACTSTTALASGFALIEQSASQMGNAFAGGAAFANDASTIFFNPAGMTRVPHQAIVGLHSVSTTAKFDGSATDPAGGSVSGGNGGDAGGTGLVPNFYYSLPMGKDLFTGIGISVPFGLSTEYDDGWKGRYQAIESELKTININPSLAYRFNSQFSAGFGFNLMYVDAKLTQNIDQGSLCVPTQAALQARGVPGADPALCAGLTPQGADAFAKVEGDNWGGGFNLGVLYEPTTSTRVGLSYRSRIKQQLTGQGRFSGTLPQFSSFGIFVRTDVSADLNLPESASLSVYHDVNSKWSVMADATWTKWNEFEELRIEYDSNQPDTAIDQSWNNSMRYSAGLDYRYNNRWTFRVGTAFDETPIPNKRKRTARIPGEDRIWASLGVGYRINQDFTVDVGYSHLFVDDPKIDNGEATTGTITGEYDADVDIFSAQLVWDI